jgi:hypothetical protein
LRGWVRVPASRATEVTVVHRPAPRRPSIRGNHRGYQGRSPEGRFSKS